MPSTAGGNRRQQHQHENQGFLLVYERSSHGYLLTAGQWVHGFLNKNLTLLCAFRLALKRSRPVNFCRIPAFQSCIDLSLHGRMDFVLLNIQNVLLSGSNR
jgi:hypothetical protein